MKKVIVLIAMLVLLVCSIGHAAEATVSWEPNSESDLAGYKVYYGNSSRNYDTNIDVGNITSYTISNLVEGKTYFFVATAYDESDNESDYSNEVSYAVPMTETIIDNGESGTSFTGTWYSFVGLNSYGANSLYANPGATYTFEAAINGVHEVSLWWTVWRSRCTNVPIEIYDGNTLLDTVNVNHLENGGQWNVLGSYSFSGTARVVTISQGGGGCTTSADAVKFVLSILTVDKIAPAPPIMISVS